MWSWTARSRRSAIQLGLLMSSFTVFAQPPPQITEEDSLEIRGKAVRYEISLDRIGFLTRENVPLDEFETNLGANDVLAAFGAQAQTVQRLAARMFVLEISHPLLRGALNQVARRFERDKGTLILNAGLVVREQARTAPIILTNELVVGFREEIPPENLSPHVSGVVVTASRRDPFDRKKYLLRIERLDAGGNARGLDALEASRIYREDPRTEFSYPNFLRIVQLQDSSDPYLEHQWHHDDSADSDVDTSLAWQFLGGETGPVIAIIDEGFDTSHPDLPFWSNPQESAGGPDDDGSYGDDLMGVNFGQCTDSFTCDPNSLPDITTGPHGTAAAGLAAAIQNNGRGVSGVCPRCKVMLIQMASNQWFDANGSALTGVVPLAQAFDYATRKGARIISNSYTIQAIDDGEIPPAIDRALAQDIVVVFSMTNLSRNNCVDDSETLASHEGVLSVGALGNEDHSVSSGYGNCMDLLAPGIYGATTDVRGTEGINSANSSFCGNQNDLKPADGPDPLDYTKCFKGTSMAAPIVAGVAGLVRTVSPELTEEQVRRLLQDTADKIEPGRAQYHLAYSGYGGPASGSTHGWGRVNAFEAVRIAAPVGRVVNYDRREGHVVEGGDFETSGKAGVDVFIRDHPLDWGNTEPASDQLFEPIPVSTKPSPDIKVDAPDYLNPEAFSLADFEGLVSEPVQANVDNYIYVRLRNRGPRPANSTKVKLFWAPEGNSLPRTPSDLWRQFPGDPPASSPWRPVPCADNAVPVDNTCDVNVPYSGASVAKIGNDRAVLVRFRFRPDAPLPELSFVAAVDAPNDGISDEARRANGCIDKIAPIDNNIAYLVVSGGPPSPCGGFNGWIWIVFAVVAVVLLIWFFTRRNPEA